MAAAVAEQQPSTTAGCLFFSYPLHSPGKPVRPPARLPEKDFLGTLTSSTGKVRHPSHLSMPTGIFARSQKVCLQWDQLRLLTIGKNFFLLCFPLPGALQASLHVLTAGPSAGHVLYPSPALHMSLVPDALPVSW